MDPVVVTTIGVIIAALLSGGALVMSSKSNSTATATAALLNGQDTAIKRMEAQIAARDSTIQDLRDEVEQVKDALEDCERTKRDQQRDMDKLTARVKELEP